MARHAAIAAAGLIGLGFAVLAVHETSAVAECSLAGPGPPERDIASGELATLYACVVEQMRTAYARSGHADARAFLGWALYSDGPYVSATHGSRYVANYANPAGESYGAFEASGPMRPGTKVAKPSFTVTRDGLARLGPLFLMEKMPPGFDAESGDWRYTMILPAGTIVGTTGGTGSEQVHFCIDCHAMVDVRQDHLFYPPEWARPHR